MHFDDDDLWEEEEWDDDEWDDNDDDWQPILVIVESSWIEIHH